MKATFQEFRSQPTQPCSSPRTATKIPPVVKEVLRSPGQPLDAATRVFMEPRFGYNFGNVRVHNDQRAGDSARAVNAQAYTVGQDVVFGANQFAPESYEGRQLLAHELAHTVQQRGALGGDLCANQDRASESDADSAAAQLENAERHPALGFLSSVSLQMQPASGTADREEQLWKELGIDFLLADLELNLADNQFPHPDTIESGKGMKGQGTQLALGEIYDTSDLEFKLHTYTWGWTHSSLRLQRPEKLTHKELAYLYYWYGDETRQIQRALEKLAATIKDEQRRKELQEVAAYFKATERFVAVTFGVSAAGGAALAAGGATVLGAGARAVGTGARIIGGGVRAAATTVGETATSAYVKANLATGAAVTAAGGAAAKIGTEILTNPAVQWAGQNPNVATAAVETAATSGPKILEGTYTKEDALLDILTLAQARGADISLGTPGPSTDVGESELTTSIRQPASTIEPSPSPPRRGASTGSMALDKEIDAAFDRLQAGKAVGSATGKFDPAKDPHALLGVRVPVNKEGEPANVLDVGAGSKPTDLGLPPERNLVAIERSDIKEGAHIDHVFDATKAPPPALLGKMDTLVINNPRGYTPNIAELAKALKPGGRIIVQGRARVGPVSSRNIRGFNPDFQALLDSPAPAGFKKIIEIDQGGLPPSLETTSADILGGPFYKTEGDQRVWPNARVIFERTAAEKATETHE